MSAEENMRAACVMRDAAEINLRAANLMSETTHQLQLMFGQGYGNNIEQLIEELRKLNERAPLTNQP